MQMHNHPNNFRASFRSSENLTDFKTVQMGDMQVIVGRSQEGSLYVQSILFPKTKYDLATATIKAFMFERIYS